ncbi:MAG: hypothetical protein WC455_09275 [Dehalococcoidia bacterium]|jgi:hypothetical protein
MPGYRLIVIRKGRNLEMGQESMWTQEGALDRAKTLIRSGKIDPQRETVFWIKAFSVGNGPVEIELGEFTHEDLGIVKRRVGRPSNGEEGTNVD